MDCLLIIAKGELVFRVGGVGVQFLKVIQSGGYIFSLMAKKVGGGGSWNYPPY